MQLRQIKLTLVHIEHLDQHMQDVISSHTLIRDSQLGRNWLKIVFIVRQTTVFFPIQVIRGVFEDTEHTNSKWPCGFAL